MRNGLMSAITAGLVERREEAKYAPAAYLCEGPQWVASWPQPLRRRRLEAHSSAQRSDNLRSSHRQGGDLRAGARDNLPLKSFHSSASYQGSGAHREAEESVHPYCARL